jgi:hypothetical protein
MRKVGLALIAVTAVISFAAPMADAAVTCTMISSMCPKDHPKGESFKPSDRTSVPEPATLTLLGAGVAAVGAAIARRRKKN